MEPGAICSPEMKYENKVEVELELLYNICFVEDI